MHIFEKWQIIIQFFIITYTLNNEINTEWNEYNTQWIEHMTQYIPFGTVTTKY